MFNDTALRPYLTLAARLAARGGGSPAPRAL